MHGHRDVAFAVLGLVALLAFGGAPAWAANTIDVPEPRDLPDQSNNFNIMTVADVHGQPMNESENVIAKITFSSSSEIAKVQVLDDGWDPAAPTPYKSSDGTWNFDVAPPQDNYRARNSVHSANAIVVTYKSGRKRLLLIAPYAKSITLNPKPYADKGTVYVSWSFGDTGTTTMWTDWWPYTTGPAPSAPAAPPGQKAPVQKPVKPGDDKGGKDD